MPQQSKRTNQTECASASRGLVPREAPWAFVTLVGLLTDGLGKVRPSHREQLAAMAKKQPSFKAPTYSGGAVPESHRSSLFAEPPTRRFGHQRRKKPNTTKAIGQFGKADGFVLVLRRGRNLLRPVRSIRHSAAGGNDSRGTLGRIARRDLNEAVTRFPVDSAAAMRFSERPFGIARIMSGCPGRGETQIGSDNLLVGPVFTREAVTAPRRARLYISRTAYVGALWALLCTAWMVLTGAELVRNLGDLARFWAIVFQILAPLQLAVVVFFSALSTASAVSQEKDRRTLILLLMTRLSNSELVLGKLMASMLNVLVLLAAALPLFVIAGLFGGVSQQQVLRCFAITLLSALAAGSLGSTIALWRDKTFQTLALTALILVFWIAGWQMVGLLGANAVWAGVPAVHWAAMFSPWLAIQEAAQPTLGAGEAGSWWSNPGNLFLLVASMMAILLNLVAIVRVRVWNPSREVRDQREREEAPEQSIFSSEIEAAAQTGSAKPQAVPAKRSVHAAPGPTRQVWDNPILWREMRTWAYGRKVMMIRLVWLVLFGLSAASLYYLNQTEQGITRGPAALALAPLFVLSLTLINAQAVTSVTTERDGRALDLLLATDLTPKEFIFGKLGGVFFNTKEMVLLPALLCGYLWYARAINGESLFFLVAGLLVLDVFVATLGIHAGMAYGNSRTAIGASLGTVFFLFVGVATCMRIMVAFGGSFQVQLAPFLAFTLGGGVGLFVTLGIRNPSPAITLAALLCPFATFYAITSFLLNYTLGVFLVVVFTYGFTTAAMLIPAVYEFDVATGRTTSED